MKPTAPHWSSTGAFAGAVAAGCVLAVVGVELVAAVLASGALDDVDSGAVVVTVTPAGSESPDMHAVRARRGRATAARVFAIRVRMGDLMNSGE